MKKMRLCEVFAYRSPRHDMEVMMNFPNLRRHLFLQKKWMISSTILLLIQAGTVVLTPLPLKAIIDGLFVKKHSATVDFLSGHYGFLPNQILLILAGTIGFLALVTATTDFFEEYLLNAASHHTMEGIRQELTSLLLTRRLSAVEQRRKIDILGRLSGDIANLDVLIISGLSVFVRALPMLVMVLISMFITDWRFSAILIVAVPLMAWIGYFFSARLKVEMRRLRYAVNDFEQDTTQSLEALQLIKSFSIETTMRKSLHARITNIRVLTLISRISQGGLVGSLTLIRSAVRIGVLLVGGFGILRGDFSLGTLVVFLAYTETLGKPVNELSKFSSKWAKSVTSIRRFEELYDEFQMTGEAGGSITRAPERTTLVFDQVTHGYPNGPTLLNDFSAHFHAREVVGVVGASGTGKSSFIRLINRLCDPVRGEIRFAGLNVRDYDLKTLRELITIVYQEPFFLHASVRENLSLVLPEKSFSDQELWRALAKVNGETFVRELPEGLDTVIGEGGRRLSGGQLQRLSLARAFLRVPSMIYIFDEATSGLDPVSAQIVFESVRKLKDDGRIIFWITHRHDELEFCHRVVQFRFDGNPVCAAPTETRDIHANLSLV